MSAKKFKRFINVPALRARGLSQIPGTTVVTTILQDNNGRPLLCMGINIPSDGETGFAKGCVFIKTDAGAGVAANYENVGTITSCNFDLMDLATGGVTTFLGLSDTPANYTDDANKIVKVNTGETALEFVTPSGDVTMGATGVFAIGTGVIIDADVNASAAIAYSKLAAMTSARILVGSAGNVPTVVAVTGDVALSNAGVTTVTDLTITGEAQGDILYFNGTNWVRLGAGINGQFLKTQGAAANPVWDNTVVGTANALSSPFTLEGGASDPSTTVTAQTVGAAALTIPDLAGVAQQWVFSAAVQTLTNKTLTSPVFTTPQINDTSADHQYIFAVSELAADRTVTWPLLAGNDVLVFESHAQTLSNKTLTAPILSAPQINDTSADHQYVFVVSELAADRNVTLPLLTGNDVFVFADFIQVLTNKTLDDATTKFGDTADPTKDLFFSLGGATADKTMTIVSSQTLDRQITLPDATDTLVGKATADVFTNKAFDCLGVGNSLTNVNGLQLDPIAATVGTYGIPIVVCVPNAGAATVSIFTANAPYKFRLIDAWAINTKAANNGSWKIDNGATDITSTVAYGAGDEGLTRADSINDATHVINANGSLRLINSDATDTAIVYVSILRVD